MALLTEEQELSALKEERQKILLGKKRTEVNWGEKSAKFRDYATDLEKIEARIAELERKLGHTKPNRPFRVSM